MYILVPAAEIRDHETGLVSGPFSWFQSRQLFLETHEIEANSISYNKHTLWKGRLRLWVCRCFYLNSGLKNLLAMPSVMNVIPSSLRILFELLMRCSDAGRWKTLGVPVVISGNNLPSPVGIGLTDLPNIGGGGAVAPTALFQFRHHCRLNCILQNSDAV